NLLTVHYHRFDGDYASPGLWTWDEHNRRSPHPQDTFHVGRDGFGVVFQLDIGAYGQPGDKIGLIPRLNGSWEFKDGGDRFWSPRMSKDIYLVQGKNDVYTSPPDVSPKLTAASIERVDELAVRFTHRLPVAEFPAKRFVLRNRDGQQVPVTSVRPEQPKNGRANAFRLTTGQALEVGKTIYRLTVRGFGDRQVRLGGLLVDESLYYDAQAVLGATYTPQATTFRVFSPLADGVEVVVADARSGNKGLQRHPMQVNPHGVWSATVNGDLKNRFYAYLLSGPDFDPNREVTDIYAVCTTGPGGRALIVDLDATDPPGFDPAGYVECASPVDAIIYEMHVRDFTIAANSGVAVQGKYLGLTQTGTHLPGDPSVMTGLDHLVELGVTHVQIMPIQDFDNAESPDDSYNWGYMPIFFNSPDGWYATAPVGPERIVEFKQAVQALHDRGIGVIMDVVYNHTALHASFESLVPGYYFRRTSDGAYWNGSGCGNEFASEHPMARKYMLDSLAYWVTEYGIDGFRFDLMGLHDLETMQRIAKRLRDINPSILIHGEPWTGGASGLKQVTDQKRIAGTGVAAFNDHIRDAIKGGRDGGPPGFIQAGADIGRIRQGIGGAIDDWANQPTDCITYCECHDNLTTWDKLLQSAPRASTEIQKRMQRFAGLIVMTSQGIAFIHSGQELCRSKGGSHNSYNLPDSVNQIDWSLKKTNRDVFEYYRGLIALRKAHPVFRLRTARQVRRRLRFSDKVPGQRCLAYTLDGRNMDSESFAQLSVLLNGESTDQVFVLPAGAWNVVVDADRAGTETLTTAERTVTVKAHSGMVLGR
ncbi:MAG: type I pullulanase, partial [Phycisphaerae bacterium]